MIEQILAMLGPRFEEEQLRGGARKAAEASYMAQNPRLGGSESPLHMLAPLLQGEGGMRAAADVSEDANRKAAEAAYIAQNSPQQGGGGGILSMLRKRGPGIMGALRMGIDAAATPNTTGSLGANVMGGLSNAMNMRDQRTQQGYENTYKQVVAKQAQDRLAQEWQKHVEDLGEKRAGREQDSRQFGERLGHDKDRLAHDQRRTWGDEQEAIAKSGGKTTDFPTWQSAPMAGYNPWAQGAAPEDEMLPTVAGDIASKKAGTKYNEALTEESKDRLEHADEKRALDDRMLQIREKLANTQLARLNNDRNKLTKMGGLTEEQLKRADTLTSQITGSRQYNDMLDVQAGLVTVREGSMDPSGAGDIMILNGYQRLIDPGATVREADVELLKSAVSWLSMADAKFWIEKIKSGSTLPPEMREKMLELSKNLYNAYSKLYNSTTGELYKRKAEAWQIPYELVANDFEPIDTFLGGGQPAAPMATSEATPESLGISPAAAEAAARRDGWGGDTAGWLRELARMRNAGNQ